MSWKEGLVDLSLFASSPTNDQRFSVPSISDVVCRDQIAGNTFTRSNEPIREFYGPQDANHYPPDPYACKPLPRLPPRTICGTISIPRERNTEPTCILSRMKRKRTSTSPTTSQNNLLRRRNIASPPQLTLSTPQPAAETRPAPSEMVWMPDEQMWLIIGGESRHPQTEPDQYPILPAYSPPSSYARSEPSTRKPSEWSVSPPTSPVSPVRSRLQSLGQPRDDELLSPLFQEAINSVPMTDAFDPFRTPAFDRSVRRKPLRSPPLRAASLQDTKPPPVPPLPPEMQTGLTAPRDSISRAASTGTNYTTAPSHHSSSSSSSDLFRSHVNSGSALVQLKPAGNRGGSWALTSGSAARQSTHSRSHSSTVPSSISSTLEPERVEEPGSARSWHGFARKLAKP